MKVFFTHIGDYLAGIPSALSSVPASQYFHWLLIVSMFVYLLEVLLPWHRKQARIRKDFWLDAFYMFFNLFLFPILIFKLVASVSSQYFIMALDNMGFGFLLADRVGHWPVWLQLVVLFVARDFIQWNIHRLLHKVSFLWEFHKVHHSVKEMGFAAHLRFHWMENLIYNTLQYLPLAMIGFALKDYIAVYVVSILIGHLNHANINISYGPLKYVFNNPHMHIWHHAKQLPEKHSHGCNFGLSLSLWDYLFRTSYIPHEGRDIELGYVGDSDMPNGFFKQLFFGFWRRKAQPPKGS